MTSTPRPDRELDVVVFGATGFAGRLVAGHLARHGAGARIGLAGRSRDRLAAVRADLGPAAAQWPLLVADSADPGSLAALADATHVVATTVGPYAKYGLPLVEACARAGTDTCDLTGEVLFVRQCIDRVQHTAVATGSRIVNACGFDSIPSDLAVLATAERARADDQGELTDTTLALTSARGGVSGGTIDSLRNQVDEARADPALQRLVSDPYSLSPDRAAEPDLGRQPDAEVGQDPRLGGWYGPFVMGPFNTRIVRRSNALQGWSYGRRFRYREVQAVGGSVVAPALAVGLAAGLRASMAGLSFPPTRAIMDRVLPAPGQGPGERTRRTGHFRLEVHALTSTGARYATVVAAQGDPGYAATSVMLGESALCLALDRERLPAAAGVLTPATAMGGALADRLRAAGFTLEVIRTDGA